MKNESLFKDPKAQIKYWPLWLGIAFLWLVGHIPWRMLLWLGRIVGHIAWRLVVSRREAARTNIRLCFPELPAEEQEALAKAAVISTGEALLEMSGAYFNRQIDLSKRREFIGREHVEQAVADGRGVLLLGMHFNTLDVGSRMLGEAMTFSTVYRPNDNPVLDWMIREGRGTYINHSIERSNIRKVVRLLKKSNEVIWYAPDQDYGTSNAVYAPFFGVPAATITATARIARMSGAAVIPVAHYRMPKGRYIIEFGEPLEDFPSGDDVADATRVNSVIEGYVRRMPEQYLWVHRRFKHQPNGEKFYQQK